MIRISKPYLKRNREQVRLISDISTSEGTFSIWVEISEKYEKYLCTERCDGFLILLLPFAMENGETIACDAPITEELLYGIRSYFIPSLVAHSTVYKEPQIIAHTAESLTNAGAVGTGCSCGVDSFHAIYNQLDSQYPSLKLTHLCLFNTGYHSPKSNEIFKIQLERSTKVANELGLPLIVCDSNCCEVVHVPEDFNFLHTFSSMFIVFCLQKLWKVYYYSSSGYDFSYFSIEDADSSDCAKYDLLTFSSISTKQLRIYSEGGSKTRFEKTSKISNFKIAQKYLKVCNQESNNCSKCGKCMRTMLCLDAVNKLNEFKEVFDTKYYRSHYDEYMYWLFKMHSIGDILNEPTYQYFKNDPIMKKVIDKDKIWKYITRAKGLYDDGWLRKNFVATSETGINGKMFISIYIADITPLNNVSLLINGTKTLEKELNVGLHEVSVDVPKKA